MTYTPAPSPADGLRLHLNENTAGCSPAVLAALQSITRAETALYPDYAAVTRAAERWLGVGEGWVQLTNGLDEGLHVVAQAAARHAGTPGLRSRGSISVSMEPRDFSPGGAAAVIVEPAFEMYAACADAAALRTIHISSESNFDFPLEAIRSVPSSTVRLINLTDPNNPTGLPIPPGTIEGLAADYPRAFVLVDEAYADFSGRTSIGALLDRHRNIIVGRTFAKAHGLAGLRIGALVAHPGTLAGLRALLPPYSLNVCAVRALQAALGDRAYLDWYVRESVESRSLIYAFCGARGMKYWPSEANFVLVRIGARASAVTTALASRGILIRDRSASSGCAGCVRITAGVVEHTRACLAALEDVLATRTS